MKIVPKTAALLCLSLPAMAQQAPNPYLSLMQKAAAHARAHGALAPILSPNDATILNGAVPVLALQQLGIQVIPWTTNDPEKMRAILRIGVDGLISDRPDLLQAAVGASTSLPATFDVEGHRGGRGLRPENTLPAFESGLDQGIRTIETDTGVTSDHVSLIWHDQFLNPQSCRRADGAAYTLDNRAYIRDLSMSDAHRTFICDKLHSAAFPDQRNDLALSPVSVAFAQHEKLISPYVPTYVEQLFRFTRFYADFYRTGPGRTHPQAAARALTADRVHFNLETKIIPVLPPSPLTASLPADMRENHTVPPQLFVDTLCGAIVKAGMQARSDVQSFDFRTLILVEEQHPDIRTVYLTQDAGILATPFVPATLRQPVPTAGP